jgi:hypothetical protein
VGCISLRWQTGWRSWWCVWHDARLVVRRRQAGVSLYILWSRVVRRGERVALTRLRLSDRLILPFLDTTARTARPHRILAHPTMEIPSNGKVASPMAWVNQLCASRTTGDLSRPKQDRPSDATGPGFAQTPCRSPRRRTSSPRRMFAREQTSARHRYSPSE